MSKKPNNVPTKAALTLAIQELLQKGTVTTQEEIRTRLRQQGMHVNQTRISRILHKLGAIKLNEGGRVVYRLSTELTALSPRDSVKQMVTGITHNGNLIVIRTAPSSAQLIAKLLDNNYKEMSILGTLAGDDTIFVAPENIQEIEAITKKISTLLYG